jgi:hypothetical protein
MPLLLYLSVHGWCFTMFCIVSSVLNAIFICVSFNSFMIVVSFLLYCWLVLFKFSAFVNEKGLSRMLIHVSGTGGDWRNFRHIRTEVLSDASTQGRDCVRDRRWVGVTQTKQQFVTCCLNSSVSNHHGLELVSDLICDIYIHIYLCAYLNCSDQNTRCHWRELASQLSWETWKWSENVPDVQITNCIQKDKGRGRHKISKYIEKGFVYS